MYIGGSFPHIGQKDEKSAPANTKDGRKGRGNDGKTRGEGSENPEIIPDAFRPIHRKRDPHCLLFRQHESQYKKHQQGLPQVGQHSLYHKNDEEGDAMQALLLRTLSKMAASKPTLLAVCAWMACTETLRLGYGTAEKNNSRCRADAYEASRRYPGQAL